ncbi:Integrase catalytic region ISDde2 (fragment), partial [Aduncisulcus paluster]
HNLSYDLSAEGAVKALDMAIKSRKTKNRTIHHSDRGLQYTSAVYQNKLRKADMIPSMTDGYDCYQNALAERINGILKQEFLVVTCGCYDELNLLVKESIEIYNSERPHLSLKMKTPTQMHEQGCGGTPTAL